MLTIIFRLLLNLLGLVWFVLMWPLRAVSRLLSRRRGPLYATLRLPTSLELESSTNLLSMLGGRRGQADWLDWRKSVERLAADDRVHGVVVRIDRVGGGLPRALHLGDVIRMLREKGKHVVVQADELSLRTFALAMHADRIELSPPASVMMLGLHLEMFFLADALRALGIEAWFVHIGRYKTAAHRFIKRGPTRHQVENLERIVSSLCETIDLRARAHRDLVRSDWLDAGVLDASRAHARGLVDGLTWEDALPDRLSDEDGKKARILAAGKWSPPARPKWRPLIRRKPAIAVIDVSGIIVMDSQQSVWTRGRSASWRKLRKALRKVRKNRRIVGAVLAIDSPGGSALASDLIWREVQRIGERKPIVAAMDSVAASGGYYVACGCQHVFANEATLTGSIGVVAGRFSFGDVLERLRIRHAAVERGRWSSIASPVVSLDKDAKRALRRAVRATYRRFVARVAEGRAMTRTDVHALAEGRVFTGRQARDAGLVDENGTLEDAIDHVTELVGLSRRRRRLMVLPSRPSGLRALLDARRQLTTAPSVTDALRETLPAGEDLARLAMLGHLFEREPVLALSDVTWR